jgi:hypothetical protein
MNLVNEPPGTDTVAAGVGRVDQRGVKRCTHR